MFSCQFLESGCRKERGRWGRNLGIRLTSLCSVVTFRGVGKQRGGKERRGQRTVIVVIRKETGRKKCLEIRTSFVSARSLFLSSSAQLNALFWCYASLGQVRSS